MHTYMERLLLVYASYCCFIESIIICCMKVRGEFTNTDFQEVILQACTIHSFFSITDVMLCNDAFLCMFKHNPSMVLPTYEGVFRIGQGIVHPIII